jgi:transcriptional regulator
MYLPELFRDDDRANVLSLCRTRPFGTVIAHDPSAGLEISHLPLLVREAEGDLAVFAHVARGNRLGRLAEAGAKMTAVFHGPHAYVSPRWYETPSEQVPTWNYVVAHLEGPSRATSVDELESLLDELSRIHEADADEPWSTALLAPELASDLRRALVGICIRVERVSCKAKLGQNRSAEDRARVVRALRERGSPDDLAVAAHMRR